MSLLLNGLLYAVLVSAQPNLSASPSPFLIDNNSIPKIKCGNFMGTGSYVGKGLVLTARHVVSGAESCTVNGHAADIVLPTSDLDYAFLKVAITDGPRELIDCSGFHEGQQLLATGYALDLDRTVTQRLTGSMALSEEQGFKGLSVLRGAVTQGMSGGPINDLMTGAQVGIINANMAFGITEVLALPLSATPLCQSRSS